jgi:WD40 repeat protein
MLISDLMHYMRAIIIARICQVRSLETDPSAHTHLQYAGAVGGRSAGCAAQLSRAGLSRRSRTAVRFPLILMALTTIIYCVGGEPRGDQSELMRTGIRDRVTQLARVAGSTARTWSSPVLLAVLSAAAFAPLLAGAAVAAVGIGTVSAIGGSVLTDLVKAGVKSIGARGGEPSREDLETDLRQRIQEVLESGGEQAQQLRGEIAELLHRIGAAGAAIEAAVQAGDRMLQAELAAGLASVGQEFSEFGFVLADLGDQLRLIREGVDQQSAELQVAVGLQYRQAIDTRLLMEHVTTIIRQTRGTRTSGAGAGPRWADGSPYRGLVPYGQADADVFSGRALVTAELVTAVSRRLTGAGLLVVTGASGAGKSSLLRAGLMPAISRGELSEAARRWPRHVIEQATGRPLSRLATLLAGLAGLDAPAVLRSLTTAPDLAPLLVRQAIDNDARRRDLPSEVAATARLILVVDQFEEIFDPGEQAAPERAAFIAALDAIATAPDGVDGVPVALVVIAVRGDFIDRCADHPQLAAALQEGPFIVGPMAEADLRSAITGPAAAAGLEIEPGLADTILSELRSPDGDYDAGALPLLSQTMLTIWQHRDGQRLTSAGYALTGGVRSAVRSSADTVYEGLPPAQKDVARQVFQYLVTVSGDGRLARRTAERAAMLAGHTDSERASIEEVLDLFARQRLIVIDTLSAQIAHDVLLQAWPRLHEWFASDLTGHALYSQLVDDADEWDRNGRGDSYLYRGERLSSVLGARSRWRGDPSYPALSDIQHAFLDAGISADNRSKRLRRLIVAVLSALLAAAVLLAGVALVQARTARQQRQTAQIQQKVATSRLLVAQAEAARATNPRFALLLGIAADAVSSGPETQSSLINTLATSRYAGTLTGYTSAVSATSFSPDRRTLATVSTVSVPYPPSAGSSSSGSGGAAAPASSKPAGGPSPSASPVLTEPETAITLWDVSDPARPHRAGSPLILYGASGDAIAFSPDGRFLATGGTGGSAFELWDMSNPAKPVLRAAAKAGGDYDMSALAFSPDGRILATATHDHTVSLWDVSHPAHITRLGSRQIGATARVDSVAFSPDGQILATGSDASVMLWDISDPSRLVLQGSSLAGRSPLAFSAHGHLLVTHNRARMNNNTFVLWDVTNPARAARVGQQLGGNNDAVAFSPDGHTVATTRFDGTTILWDVTDPATPKQSGAPLASHTGFVVSVAFSPDGQTLVTGSQDQTAILWNLADAGRPVEIGKPVPAMDTVVFLRSGRALAAGTANGQVSLWDLSNAGRPARVGQPLPGVSALLSPDGHRLAILGSDGTVTVWNVSDPAHPVRRGASLPGSGSLGLFSPDGQMLITGDDKKSNLWDLSDPAHPAKRRSDLPPIIVLVAGFTPDSRTLAISDIYDFAGKVTLWDVADPAHIAVRKIPVIAGDFTNVTAVSFSPDSTIMITGRADGSIVVWDMSDPAQPVRIGQPLTGPNPNGDVLALGGTSSVVSATFSHDGRTLATTSVSGTILVWDLTNISTPHQIGSTAAIAGKPIFHTAFSPDDRILAGASFDRSVTMWDVSGIKTLQDNAVQRACLITGRGFNQTEWKRYVPGLPYQKTCA